MRRTMKVGVNRDKLHANLSWNYLYITILKPMYQTNYRLFEGDSIEGSNKQKFV